jgi:pyruvate/2-oxoacid:ferredoxin oxidoreductase alpha subunit
MKTIDREWSYTQAELRGEHRLINAEKTLGHIRKYEARVKDLRERKEAVQRETAERRRRKTAEDPPAHLPPSPNPDAEAQRRAFEAQSQAFEAQRERKAREAQEENDRLRSQTILELENIRAQAKANLQAELDAMRARLHEEGKVYIAGVEAQAAQIFSVASAQECHSKSDQDRMDCDSES